MKLFKNGAWLWIWTGKDLVWTRSGEDSGGRDRETCRRVFNNELERGGKLKAIGIGNERQKGLGWECLGTLGYETLVALGQK